MLHEFVSFLFRDHFLKFQQRQVGHPEFEATEFLRHFEIGLPKVGRCRRFEGRDPCPNFRFVLFGKRNLRCIGTVHLPAGRGFVKFNLQPWKGRVTYEDKKEMAVAAVVGDLAPKSNTELNNCREFRLEHGDKSPSSTSLQRSVFFGNKNLIGNEKLGGCHMCEKRFKLPLRSSEFFSVHPRYRSQR